MAFIVLYFPIVSYSDGVMALGHNQVVKPEPVALESSWAAKDRRAGLETAGSQHHQSSRCVKDTWRYWLWRFNWLMICLIQKTKQTKKKHIVYMFTKLKLDFFFFFCPKAIQGKFLEFGNILLLLLCVQLNDNKVWFDLIWYTNLWKA